MDQKIGDWNTAFNAVRQDLTPQAMRDIASIATPQGGDAEIRLGMSMARLVTANDRAAGIIAALITGQGIKPIVIGEDSEEPD